MIRKDPGIRGIPIPGPDGDLAAPAAIRRMNISKTMMLLLGSERDFDLAADSPAARALRQRGLVRTYDITPGKDDRADQLVFGRRWWLTAASAAQPRHALGVGHPGETSLTPTSCASPCCTTPCSTRPPQTVAPRLHKKMR